MKPFHCHDAGCFADDDPNAQPICGKEANTLRFGLNNAVPDGVPAAWGARLIFPDDLLPDRQGFVNSDSAEGKALHGWLNGGALRQALEQAWRLSENGRLFGDECRDVVLYEDEVGRIAGNPNKSFGYLYVAAWLKTEDAR